jgi:hypothetical protein
MGGFSKCFFKVSNWYHPSHCFLEHGGQPGLSRSLIVMEHKKWGERQEPRPRGLPGAVLSPYFMLLVLFVEAFAINCIPYSQSKPKWMEI